VKTAAKSDVGTCALCLRPSVRLQRSHIIPNFVGRHFKRSGLLFHQATRPRLPQQDTLKVRLLCRACEDRLGKDEHRFAQDLYSPWRDTPWRDTRRATFHYEEWLLRFCVGIAWRSSALTAAKILRDRPQHVDAMREASEQWRRYLLREARTPGQHSFHILLLPLPPPNLPPDDAEYFTNTIETTTAANDTDLFVWTHLGRVVLWAQVSPPRLDGWRGTRVHKHGTLHPSRQRVKAGSLAARFVQSRLLQLKSVRRGVPLPE
jgi:hypothetical protein